MTRQYILTLKLTLTAVALLAAMVAVGFIAFSGGGNIWDAAPSAYAHIEGPSIHNMPGMVAVEWQDDKNIVVKWTNPPDMSTVSGYMFEIRLGHTILQDAQGLKTQSDQDGKGFTYEARKDNVAVEDNGPCPLPPPGDISGDAKDGPELTWLAEYDDGRVELRSTDMAGQSVTEADPDRSGCVISVSKYDTLTGDQYDNKATITFDDSIANPTNSEFTNKHRMEFGISAIMTLPPHPTHTPMPTGTPDPHAIDHGTKTERLSESNYGVYWRYPHLAEPSGVSAQWQSGNNPDKVTVSWDPVPGATGYVVYMWAYDDYWEWWNWLSLPVGEGRESSPPDTFVNIDLDLTGAKVEATVENLPIGPDYQNYFFRVKPYLYNEVVHSNSTYSYYRLSPDHPDADEAGRIRVTEGPVSHSYHRGGDWSSYVYVIAQETATVPSAPRGLNLSGQDSKSMRGSWDPPKSDGGSDITGYTVLYQPNGGSVGPRSTDNNQNKKNEEDPTGGIVETTDTSVVITGLTDGVEYSVRVLARNAIGESPLSDSVIGTPGQATEPLEAEFPSSPYSSWTHSGTDDRPQVVVAFSRPVASFTASTPSVSVAGGTLLSGQAHEEQGLENAYILFLDPAGTDAIQFNLVPNEPCDSGGICAKDGTTLSVVPVTHTILGPATENTPATGAPTISGTARVGETLAASISGIADADGLDNAVFAYLWLADDVGIAGATGSSYTVVDADEEKTIKVRVTFTDDGGNQETLTSEPTAAVAAKENTPATGAPTITGTAQVGETLTASVGDIGDDDGIANAEFSYQWLADGAEITDATGGSYTLIDADAGKAIKVRASFTDDEGNAESLTSAATAVVEEAEPTEPPPKPTNLTARVNGDGSITLSWEAPDDDSVTGYQILRRRPTQGEDTLLVYVEDTGSTATAYTDTNVTAGVRHVYRVKAINSAGVGAQSNYVNPTP